MAKFLAGDFKILWFFSVSPLRWRFLQIDLYHVISCYISSIWLSKGLGNPWKPRNHQLISTAFWTAVHREATRHKAFRGQLGVTQSATVEINPQVWVAFIRLENVSVTCQGFSIHSNCIQMSTFLVCNPMLQHTYTIHDRPTGLPWYYHVPYCPQPCGSAWGHTGRDPGTSPVQCSIALTISNLSPFHRWNAVVAGCDRKWPGDLD